MEHPINHIVWLPADELRANGYNPNVCFSPEMKLLEHSILTNGWIQPILISRDKEIIDGFHRYSLALHSEMVRGLTGGQVPCAILELSEPERMMLTIRINRAKGSHIAIRMHDVITKLVQDHGVSKEEIAKGIGANRDEVDLLLIENVFEKFDIKNHSYSKAWYPK